VSVPFSETYMALLYTRTSSGGRLLRWAEAMPLRFVISLLFTTVGWAQGLMPGASIAEFRLPDQTGTLRSFSDIRGPRGAMLVFYRSADW
jgi:hypothetical protein